MSCSLLCVYLVAFGISHYLSVEAFYGQWGTSKSRAQNSTVRTARGVDTPAPVDCRLKQWSPWASCSPCKEETYRFSYLEQPAQFRGTLCRSGQWEDKTCTTGASCEKGHVCANGFTCKETGRCVSEKLRCNQDRDCRDMSDEDGCEEENFFDGPCTYLSPIPGSERATLGYNILTREFALATVDPTYFGGVCEYVYNGEWRKLVYDAFCENLYYNDDEKHYRKPYNFHTYRFMGHANSVGSDEYYDDAASLLNARKEEDSFNLGFTLGINTLEFGLSGSTESQLLRNISQYQEQNMGFVRLVSKVQTAQFKMRSSGIMLDEDMYQHLVELPEEYDFGPYSRFLTQYGTHYITSGTMGGSLEYIVVIDKSVMASSDITGEQTGHCLGASLGFEMSSSSSAKLKASSCEKTGSLDNEKENSNSYIKDVIRFADGGNTGTSGGVLAVKDAKAYTSWGNSLKYNPALIEFEMLPLYELIRFSTVAGPMKGKVALLKRAYEEYLHEFNSCRCAPCRNNGIAALEGTSCVCLCKEGYKGLACEETLRTGPTHGSWSCWSSWSSCQSNQKTRQRQCNNPAPLKSGQPCLGRATKTQDC